jgi:serine phosphatase RsbU (regulator of sigma subunit)
MVYANAGHPPPLVVRKNGAVEPLAVTGPALGFPHVAPMREEISHRVVPRLSFLIGNFPARSSVRFW